MWESKVSKTRIRNNIKKGQPGGADAGAGKKKTSNGKASINPHGTDVYSLDHHHVDDLARQEEKPRTGVRNRRIMGCCHPVSLHPAPPFCVPARLMFLNRLRILLQRNASSILGYNLASTPGLPYWCGLLQGNLPTWATRRPKVSQPRGNRERDRRDGGEEREGGCETQCLPYPTAFQ